MDEEREQEPMVFIEAESFEQAVDEMEECVRRRTDIDELMVFGGYRTRNEVEQGVFASDALWFRRFVELLELKTCVVLRIVFGLSAWENLRTDLMEHLFETVLPAHHTLRSIDLASERWFSNVPARFVQRLVSSIPAAASTVAQGVVNPPLSCLSVRVPDRETSRAVADMIRRNVPLTSLRYQPQWDFDDDALVVCPSAHSNNHLLSLVIDCGRSRSSIESLDQISASPSLTRLCVNGRLSQQCLLDFGMQMRTNTTITRLSFWDTSRETPNFFQPIEDALRRFNFTLLDVNLRKNNSELGAFCRRVTWYTRRNQRIQRALERLRPVSYHLSPYGLLPRALEVVTDLPTLLYRFLRGGNVNALADFLQTRRHHVVDEEVEGNDGVYFIQPEMKKRRET